MPAEPLPFPRRINVEPTNHCNQRCPLCPRQGFTRPLGFMDLDLFASIARECAAHPTRLWLHFLGEPLLHRDAVEMIRIAKRAGVSEVGLSTNAVSLGTYTDAILDSGLDRLECSMDAIDEEGYRRMRGRNHFRRAEENITGFLERKRERGSRAPVTSIQFMRTAEMEAAIPQIIARWEPRLSPPDFIMAIDPAPFGGAIERNGHGRDAANGPRPPCRWLFEALMILQDGTVTMCGADWDARAPLGNVRESSIREIWTGAKAERRRAAHRAGRFADVGPCAQCEDWRLADGHGYLNLLENT